MVIVVARIQFLVVVVVSVALYMSVCLYICVCVSVFHCVYLYMDRIKCALNAGARSNWKVSVNNIRGSVAKVALPSIFFISFSLYDCKQHTWFSCEGSTAFFPLLLLHLLFLFLLVLLLFLFDFVLVLFNTHHECQSQF
jgi:hypothetical protein